jgi:hypothetical protein
MPFNFRLAPVLIWLAVSCVAVASCLLNKSAARIGEDLVPVGHDSYYHARRILDTVASPGDFYQFDDRIHAPEGSLLVWPWGYDYAMALVVRAGMALGLSEAPINVLLAIPVAAVCLSIGLLILVSRRLGLADWPTTLAALCMALAPTTQLLHGYGAIDHHFAELIFVLSVLASALAWFRAPSARSGITLGIVFGVSLAVHNGLFILQLPFLATLLIHWWQKRQPPKGPTLAFAGALLLVTLAVCLPSLPFRLGRFEFCTLSWFHLYVSCGTALTAVLLAWLQPDRKSLMAIAALAAVLLAPLLHEIRIAQSFLSGSLGVLDGIQEMRAPLRLAREDRPMAVTYFYSFLIWLAPLTLVLCMVQCWRERQSPRLLFWISAAMGLCLLSTQLRMHYFGGYALYLPWLVLLDDFAARHAPLRRRSFLLATLALLLAYVPQIRHSLIARVPPAGDLWLERLYPIFPTLREACQEDPGVVLADATAGHYIRYFTDCSVIANNFLLTEQQFAKVDEVTQLFAGPAAHLPQRAPYVKYVLVRPMGLKRQASGDYTYSFFGEGKPILPVELLLQAQPPAGYRLLDQVKFEVRYPDRRETVPYARLYKIEATTSRPAQSVNDVSH